MKVRPWDWKCYLSTNASKMWKRWRRFQSRAERTKKTSSEFLVFKSIYLFNNIKLTFIKILKPFFNTLKLTTKLQYTYFQTLVAERPIFWIEINNVIKPNRSGFDLNFNYFVTSKKVIVLVVTFLFPNFYASYLSKFPQPCCSP